MAWYDAGDLDTLKKNERIVIEFDNQKILLIWHGNEVHAVQSQCPHLKLPLFKSQITEQNEIVCPFHKSSFDLCSGDVKCWSPWPKVVSGLLGKISKPKNLRIYPVKLEADRVMVEV